MWFLKYQKEKQLGNTGLCKGSKTQVEGYEY
jgi:hypothetical protein